MTPVLALLWLAGAAAYEAPDDCAWWPAAEGVHLACSLRTINSELDTTNFSAIPAERTTALTAECNQSLGMRSALASSGFAHLTSLRSLAIEHCKLARLGPGALDGLTGLRNLTIRTHSLGWPALSLEVARDAFSSVPSLERLDLSTNNIWAFPEGVFCPLGALLALNVSWNRLQDVSDLGFREKAPPPQPLLSGGEDAEPAAPPRAACALDVHALDASGNHFVLLPAQGFGALRGLRDLRLAYNEISMVAERALGGLAALVRLELSHNRIVALPPELFREASSSLQEIHLQNNSISVLSPGLFADLNQLLELDLSRNQLTSAWINSGTFSGLIRLVLLNLSHNRITKLDPTFFHDLYTLQILNLDHNAIETIPADTFTPMNNLHTLVLSYNKISKLDAFALNGLYVLSTLSLDNNLLSDIHVEAFRNCTGLQDLNISGNKLTSVPMALKDMRVLRTVDLGENMISDIDNPGFSGMTNLYGLRLIGNQLTHIGKGSFAQLPSLEILNLSRNKINKIQSGAFEANTNLQAIRLDTNELTDITDLFSDVPSLVWLNISDNRLDWFDYSLLPSGLQWLYIQKNFISELGNHRNIDDLKIVTLDASFNKLTIINDGMIPDSIEILFLNDNQISTVKPHTFMKKINLSRVDLYANQIEEMELSALQLTPVDASRPLPEFYIGGNPFQCDCTMEWLQRINKLDYLRQHPKVMDLEGIYCKLLYSRERLYIPLVEAESSDFLCSYKTHCFALCTCCDFDACDCEMTCPTNCTCYHDQSWAANIVDCSGAGYIQMPTSIPMDATEVYLDGNNFGELSSHSFIGRKNLKVLYANNSNVAAIYNHTFTGLRRLLVLHLENNRIKELLGSELSSLEGLRELYLQGNIIQYISNRTFSHLKQLEVLRLENNRLTRYSVSSLIANPYLVEIGLSQNQWSCDCGYMKEFSSWLRSNYAKVADAKQIACYVNNKTNLVGPGLKDFNHTWCSVYTGRSRGLVDRLALQDYLPLMLLTFCGFVGGTVAVCAVFLYRRELRRWVYSRCGFGGAVDRDDRVFDAYITYSAKDDLFVREALAPGLEPPYRLCLHYRDFNMSSYVADTIVEAVESSKRTIVVVTRNFVSSEWCRFEYKSALSEVLKERGRRGLIAVLASGLRTQDLDPDLRIYLRAAVVIEWGDRNFWQKLRYAMPEPRPQQDPKLLQPHFLHHNPQPLWA